MAHGPAAHRVQPRLRSGAGRRLLDDRQGDQRWTPGERPTQDGDPRPRRQLDFSNLDFLVAREKKALLATDRYLQFGASSDAMSVALELVITKQPPDFVDDVRRLVSKAKGVEIPIHAEAPLH